jgi:hypothetical protein
LEDKPGQQQNLDVPTNRAPNRRSDVILSEYESYWAGSDNEGEEPQMSASALHTFSPAPLAPKPAKQPELTKELPESVADKHPPTTIETAPAPPVASTAESSSAQPGFLTQRFSWEMTPADSPVKEETEPKAAESTTQSSARAASSKGLQLDPLSLNPKLSSEHLQIRNAEPGELPTPEEARPSIDSIVDVTPRPVEEPLSPVQGTPIRETPAGPRLPSSHKLQDIHSVRPPSFREILAIKSTPARIAKYNETRLQFAGMNTGLDQWLKSTVATNPQLRDVNAMVHRPSVPITTTGSPSGARHKATASLTRVFSGQGDRLSAPADSTPEHRPSHSPSDRTSAAALKGKDLLNKAGVLGGKGVSKGMKEAKGLFAKGKSRFRSSGSEKVDD